MRVPQLTAPAAGLAALLAVTALVGCGAARPGAPKAAAASASRPAAAKSRAAGDRLIAIAFTSPSAGYGAFTSQAGGRCRDLAGATTDGGAHFGPLARVASWPCGGYPRASLLAADGYGDAFLYDPGLFVSHDGGRTWAAGHQRGTVLAIAAAGRSVWEVQADCKRAAHSCPLRLLESANGGRSWAPSPTQPPGAAVYTAGGPPGQEGALGQTWLVRTGRSSAYMLTGPGQSGTAPLWFTTDAGASWSGRRVRCGINALSVTLSAAADGTLLAVCAGEPSAGYQAKSAARSTNGGRSWRVHFPCRPPRVLCRGDALDFGYLGQIAAAFGSTGYLAGDRSSLLVTTDGGAHWQPARPVIGSSAGGTSGVVFVNRRDGFVIDDDPGDNNTPTLWRTIDGGAHWFRAGS